MHLRRPRFAAILQDPEAHFEQWQDEYKQVRFVMRVTAEPAHGSRDTPGQAQTFVARLVSSNLSPE